MRPTLITIILFILLLFSCKSNNQIFWEWFSANQFYLYDYENNRAKIIADMQKQLGKVNSFLSFQFGPTRQDGTRDFIITANEKLSIFEYVESLYASAPKLEKFKIIKFKPIKYPLTDIVYDNIDHDYNNIKISLDDVRFLLAKDNRLGKPTIILFVINHDNLYEHDRNEIGLIFLEQALGEYDFATNIGRIQFETEKSEYFKKSIPITELSKYFDEYLKRK